MSTLRTVLTLSCSHVHRVRHVHPWLAAEAARAAEANAHAGPASLGELPDFRGPSRLLKDAYKKMSLELHPDKQQVHEWLENNKDWIRDEIRGIDAKRDELEDKWRREHPTQEDVQMEKLQRDMDRWPMGKWLRDAQQ